MAQFNHALNPSPSVTLTIRQILDLACGSRDNCPIEDIHLVEILRLKDPKEDWIHIEYPGDNTVSKNLLTPLLWRIGNWRASHERWKQVRDAEERRRKEFYKLQEWRSQLITAVMRDTGLERDGAEILANGYLAKSSPIDRFNACKVYGVIIDRPSPEEIEKFEASKIKITTDPGDWPVPTGDEPHNQCPEV